jgi:hypothetical protein
MLLSPESKKNGDAGNFCNGKYIITRIRLSKLWHIIFFQGSNAYNLTIVNTTMNKKECHGGVQGDAILGMNYDMLRGMSRRRVDDNS